MSEVSTRGGSVNARESLMGRKFAQLKKVIDILYAPTGERIMNSLFGQILLDDDDYDYGWFTYYDRPGHKDHPSPWHHWQLGVLFIAIGEGLKWLYSFFDTFGINTDKLNIIIMNAFNDFLSKFWMFL